MMLTPFEMFSSRRKGQYTSRPIMGDLDGAVVMCSSPCLLGGADVDTGPACYPTCSSCQPTILLVITARVGSQALWSLVCYLWPKYMHKTIITINFGFLAGFDEKAKWPHFKKTDLNLRGSVEVKRVSGPIPHFYYISKQHHHLLHIQECEWPMKNTLHTIPKWVASPEQGHCPGVDIHICLAHVSWVVHGSRLLYT